MATNNLNKIVRGNLNFKPWIAAKNPTEIVNNYVQQIYQKIPDNFKNDLLKTKMDMPRAENRVQFRAQKAPVEKFTFPIIATKQTSKLRSNGYRSPAITAKNSFVSAPKKLLKTPNFRIYSKRRYASSISSSKSSFRRKNKTINEEYQKTTYKPVNYSQFRNFTGTNTLTNINSALSKYIGPTRLFNEPFSRTKTAEISNAICHDLMSVNEMLKEKIRVSKPKTASIEPLELTKPDLLEISFKGWNHPSTAHYNKLTAKPVVKMNNEKKKESLGSGSSSFRLMPVKRKPLVRPQKLDFPGTSSKKDIKSSKHKMSGYSATSGGSKDLKFDVESPKSGGSKESKCCGLNALDFVCMSRAERGLRRNENAAGRSTQSYSRY